MQETDGSAPEPDVGEVFDGRYAIVAPLGRGGVGGVYRAERLKLGLPVAIKLLHAQSTADDELRLRFEREARVMAALSHPNIVSVSDFGVWEGRPYLVMELLEGQSLRERLGEGALSVNEVGHVGRQLLRGLAYAHSSGLLHRDLKPDNVYLQRLPDELPHVKILDFGFAKFVGDDAPPERGTALTRHGMVFGTPAYMSPEQAMGDAMDARTDVYAAGVILYEMLAGQRPFEGDFVEQRKLKLTEDAPPLLQLRPDLEPGLVGVVERALARESGARHADGAAMLEAFEQVTASAPSRLPAAGGTAPQPNRVLVIGGLAAVVGLLAWFAGSRAAPDAAPPAASTAAGAGSPVEDPRTGSPVEMVIALDELAMAVLADAEEPAVKPPAADPWKRAALPRNVERIRQRAIKKRKVAGAGLTAVRRYARTHPMDARGRLIMAYIYGNRGWVTDAIARYEVAYRIDPASRGDRRMRRDLLRYARGGQLAERAGGAIATIYGAEAIPWIERSLERDRLTAAERDRLSALIGQLR